MPFSTQKRGGWNRGAEQWIELFNGTVANGGSTNGLPIITAGFEVVWCLAHMVGSVTAGELVHFILQGYPDDVNLTARSLAGLESKAYAGVQVVAGDLWDMKQYECKGWNRIQAQVNNGAATPKTVQVWAMLGGGR